MRIDIIGDFAYPQKSAALSRVLTIARALLQERHDVRVMAMSGSSSSSEFRLLSVEDPGRAQGLEIYSWTEPANHAVSNTGLMQKLSWLVRTYIDARIVHRWLATRVPSADVVLLYGRSFARLAPVVRIVHKQGAVAALDVTEGIERFNGFGGRLSPVYWDWWLGTRLLPRQVELVTVISRALAQRCREYGARRIFQLPALEEWPESPAVKPIADGPFRLFCFSAMTAKDAPAQLEQIARELLGRQANIRIEIVGRYNESSEGRYWADRLRAVPGADRCLVFHGSAPEDRLQELLSSADGFLLLKADTVAERLAFPTRLVEILRFGIPVFASAVGDVADDLQDGVSVVLLPPEPAAATDKITSVASRADRGRSIGRAGWQTGRLKYDRAKIVPKLVAELSLASRPTQTA